MNLMTSHLLPNGSFAFCVTNQQVSVEHKIRAAPSASKSAFEITSELYPDFNDHSNSTDTDYCSDYLLLGWARIGANTSTPASINNDRGLESSFMMCTSNISTALYNVTVSTDGRVLNSTQISAYEKDVSPYFEGNASSKQLFAQVNRLLATGGRNLQWHNDSSSLDWINTIIKQSSNSSSIIDPNAPVPNASDMVPMMNSLYKGLFATLIGLNSHVFGPAVPGNTMNATITTLETRIFITPIMFKITITLLGLHLLVAITVYVRRPKRFLPRMPTTIASIIAYVSASHLLQDLHNHKGSTKPMKNTRLAYGRFIGTDGRSHVGIEKKALVVPLESKKPELRKRTWTLRGRKEKNPWMWI